jgi:hypothetical protein
MKVITTPKGVARWPKVNKPDTKFDENGVYSVDLILDGKDAETLIKQITEVRDAGYKEICAKEKKAKLKLAPMPFKAEEADDGTETGRTIFKFKLKAKGKSRDGSMYERKVALFDSKGAPSKAEIWGGSTIKVAFEPRAWFVAVHGVGVALQLKAVQVIELVSKGSGDSQSFGFGKEDGYTEESAEIVAENNGEGNGEAVAPATDSGDF